jgi:chromosome segregation ATPase
MTQAFLWGAVAFLVAFIGALMRISGLKDDNAFWKAQAKDLSRQFRDEQLKTDSLSEALRRERLVNTQCNVELAEVRNDLASIEVPRGDVVERINRLLGNWGVLPGGETK